MWCGVGLIGRGLVFGGALVMAMAGCSGSSAGFSPTGGHDWRHDANVRRRWRRGNREPDGRPGTATGSNGNPEARERSQGRTEHREAKGR